MNTNTPRPVYGQKTPKNLWVAGGVFDGLDVLDEIWDLIESVSEGFLTYSLM